MKAREWVAVLQKVPESDQPVEERFADFIKEYGNETSSLVAERTKFSKPESKFSASEGAIKEQRNKFQSICGQFPALTVDVFDRLLETAVPEWKQMVEAQQKKKQKDEEFANNIGRSFQNDGRKFANKKKKERIRFGQ